MSQIKLQHICNTLSDMKLNQLEFEDFKQITETFDCRVVNENNIFQQNGGKEIEDLNFENVKNELYIEEECDDKSENLKYKFPYEINFVDSEINQELLNDFQGEKTGFVQVGPEKWFLPSKYATDAKYFYNFEVRPDDTWIVTFPRSGTTWTQEMVWLIANNLDFETAQNVDLTKRFPFLEFSSFVHDETKQEFLHENSHLTENILAIEKMTKPGWQAVAELPSPRFIKTHFPFSLLPPNLLSSGCKVIYVARNPKDVAVSFYHLNRLIRTQGYVGDFPKYWNYFQNNLHAWTPYWQHIQEGWDRRHHDNVLFMFYEEMNKDLSKAILKVANFLDKKLSINDLQQLMQYLSIENFRKNNSVNMNCLKKLGILNTYDHGFVRKGRNGSWKEDFTPELMEQADNWIKENLKHTDLRFPSVN